MGIGFIGQADTESDFVAIKDVNSREPVVSFEITKDSHPPASKPYSDPPSGSKKKGYLVFLGNEVPIYEICGDPGCYSVFFVPLNNNKTPGLYLEISPDFSYDSTKKILSTFLFDNFAEVAFPELHLEISPEIIRILDKQEKIKGVISASSFPPYTHKGGDAPAKFGNAWINESREEILFSFWYLEEQNTYYQFGVANLDGSNPRILSNAGGSNIGEVTFSPDGKYLMYRTADTSGYCQSFYKIHLYDLEHGNDFTIEETSPLDTPGFVYPLSNLR